MLILTGQRKSEVGEARWSEFDLRNRIWTIPADRMKMDEGHEVPITDDLLALLQELPRFTKGNCVLTTDYGVSPCNGFNKAKARMNEFVATRHPEEPARPNLFDKPWVFHYL